MSTTYVFPFLRQVNSVNATFLAMFDQASTGLTSANVDEALAETLTNQTNGGTFLGQYLLKGSAAEAVTMDGKTK